MLLEYKKIPLTYKEFNKKYPPNPSYDKITAIVRSDLYPDFDELSKIQYNTVFDYTKKSYILNNYLWSLKESDKKISSKFLSNIKTLNKTLAELPTQHQKLIVYSGVRRPSNPIDWLDNHGIINIPSYLSTTLNPRMASSYTDYFLGKEKIGDMLIITIRENQNIGGYIQDISKAPEEQEFLIRCNFILKLIDKEPQTFNIHFDSGDCTLRVWNAIILDNDEIAKFDNKEVDSYKKMKNILK